MISAVSLSANPTDIQASHSAEHIKSIGVAFAICFAIDNGIYRSLFPMNVYLPYRRFQLQYRKVFVLH